MAASIESGKLSRLCTCTIQCTLGSLLGLLVCVSGEEKAVVLLVVVVVVVVVAEQRSLSRDSLQREAHQVITHSPSRPGTPRPCQSCQRKGVQSVSDLTEIGMEWRKLGGATALAAARSLPGLRPYLHLPTSLSAFYDFATLRYPPPRGQPAAPAIPFFKPSSG